MDSAFVFFRMEAADGVAQTAGRKTTIDTCIQALKAAELWTTQFDALVVCRGKGVGSTKLNWIKDANNALGVVNPAHTEDLGYNSIGTGSYINSKYLPSTQAILFTLNNACWGFKVSGTLGTATIYGALADTVGTIMMSKNSGNASLNSNYAVRESYASGYNCLSRSLAASFDFMKNAGLNTYNQVSGNLCPAEVYMLRLNYSTPYYSPTTEKLEIYWFGKALSQAKFLEFQTIMNTYIASL